MTEYDKYVLALCLIVFFMLTAVLTYMTFMVVKSNIRLIKYGVEDAKIKREYDLSRFEPAARSRRVRKIVDGVLSGVMSCLLFGALIFGIVLNFTENKKVGKVPAIKAVMSGSMSYKYNGNAYLAENGLDDQIKTYDLILLRQLPAEEDLKLYDIVLYEINGDPILHRIVGMREFEKDGEKKRYYAFRGDAVPNSDSGWVSYEQMRGVYRGERAAFWGSFVKFMQSPAGITGLIISLIVCIAIPVVDKKINDAKTERLIRLNYIVVESGRNYEGNVLPTENEREK